MESISLKDYRGKYVILFFYPKVSIAGFPTARSMLFMVSTAQTAISRVPAGWQLYCPPCQAFLPK